MKKIKNLEGQRFGRLLVINESRKGAPSGRVHWDCLCDCGNFTMVQLSNLRLGHTRSCGCLRKDSGHRNGKARFKHGDSTGVNRVGVRLYDTWSGMKKRCNNKNHKFFKNYGGRGIKICSDWEEYIAFKSWALNHGYASDLTIDRIDNNRGYHPGNCQWITQAENSRKKSPLKMRKIKETSDE